MQALGDKSISTNHAERTNSSGEVLDDPDSQRVAVDSVTANELLSAMFRMWMRQWKLVDIPLTLSS